MDNRLRGGIRVDMCAGAYQVFGPFLQGKAWKGAVDQVRVGVAAVHLEDQQGAVAWVGVQQGAVAWVGVQQGAVAWVGVQQGAVA
jgi:hypothetical protein